MDLSGAWRAVHADEALRRTFADPGTADDGWSSITVPSHWRSNAAFAASDGPLLYRRPIAAPAPAAGERWWLVFDGVFYLGDVWLDGGYLGTTEGYFNRHTFEVTEAFAQGGDHLLAVEVACPAGSDRALTGAFGRDDPAWNPGGIWRGVRLERTGPVRVRDLRVLCRDASVEQAVLLLRAELVSDEARSVELRTRVAGHDHLEERSVAEGSNFVEWTVTVPEPALWWPHALGTQQLHDLTLELRCEGAVSHTLGRRTGLRAVTRKDRILTVNGERLFLKGATVGPARPDIAGASADELRAVVTAARDAGFDLLRLRAHVSRPELYEAADELGMLIWQDLPLTGEYARAARKQAVRQAGSAVDLLGHHPSIALWCAHEWPGRGANLLEGTVARALQKADPTRPVASRAAAGLERRDVLKLGRVVPRAVRFRTGVDAAQAEALRRLKYRPSGGFCLAPEASGPPVPAGAVADVAVMADPLPARLAPGDALALDVHVVNDRRTPLSGLVEATMCWPGGSRQWRWSGEVPADDCARVGTVQTVVPEAAGTVVLDVRVDVDGASATARYEAVVAPPGDSADPDEQE